MDGSNRTDCCMPALIDGQRPDLVVVGAGSAGFSAAIRASELGARVALVGAGQIGGTCVNVGCVPSKALIRAAEAMHQARVAGRFAGIRATARLDDWAALMAQKDQLVSDLRGAKYEAVLPEYPTVRYVPGRAVWRDGQIEVGDLRLAAARAIIATGASAQIPPIPGLADVAFLDSTAALALPALPRSLLVIGGGVIGCELRQMFARFGVAVTIACRSHLLPGFDPEIGAGLARALRAEGVRILDKITYDWVRNAASGIALDYTQAGQSGVIGAERLLVATGRVANTATMGLAEAGIALDARGAVQTDAFLATSRPGTYAAGDVTGRDQYVYMAAYGAKLAAENALGQAPRRYDATAMPEIVFTQPQIAHVGLSEAQARDAGYPVRSVRLDLTALPRALAARDTEGFIKLVAEADTLRLLGAQILAPEGADTIQTAALAIKQKMTVTDLAETVFPYLTTVEGLKLAALGFSRDIHKLSCCAG